MHQHHFSLLVSSLSIAALITLVNPTQAQRPKPAPAGDCQQLAAASGGQGIWYGEYSGRAQDESSDRLRPFAGRGCFRSESECRRWTHQMMSIANGGSGVSSCRPYR